MMSDRGRTRASSRRAHARGVTKGSRLRLVAGVASVVLAGTGLAACSAANAGTGPVTLNFYFYPDTSKATVDGIDNCNEQNDGKYMISYQQLPQAADGQRQQMVRRLAAHDTTMDILGLDVTWEAEFAQAGFIAPWTGAYKAQAENGTLVPALQTAIWKGTALRGARQQQHPAAVVPLRPGPDPAHDVGPDDRRRGAAGQGGQAALHRDPGRAVRGRHRLVQHDGGQRGRHHPEPGRDPGDAGTARRQGAVDHEAAGHLRRRRPVPVGADGEPEPARHGGRARPPSS